MYDIYPTGHQCAIIFQLNWRSLALSSLKTLETLKKIKPYFLVVHMGSGQSAVYNRKYEKMFEGASSHLISYATQHSTQVSVGFRLTLPEQQPSWMFPEMRELCTCYYLYKDGITVAELRKIPED